MVRSYWKAALVLALASVSTAKAQQPRSSVPSQGQASERFVTVQEPGQPAEKCRVLLSSPLPGGGTVLKVQSLTTGNISDIIEPAGNGSVPILPLRGGILPAPSGSPQSPYAASTVVRPGPQATSGVRQVSGQSFPLAVEEHRIKPVPAANPMVAYRGASHCASCVAGGEIRTIQEPGRKPLRCRLLRRWRTGPSHYACELQCLDNGEMLTVVETGPTTTMPGTRMKAVATRIFHWGRYRTPPPGAPLPPADAMHETIVTSPMPMQPHGMSPVVVNSGPMHGGAQEVVVGPVLQDPQPRPGFFSRIRGLFGSRTPAQGPVEVVQTQVIENPQPVQQPTRTAQMPVQKINQTAPKPAAAPVPVHTVKAPTPKAEVVRTAQVAPALTNAPAKATPTAQPIKTVAAQTVKPEPAPQTQAAPLPLPTPPDLCPTPPAAKVAATPKPKHNPVLPAAAVEASAPKLDPLPLPNMAEVPTPRKVAQAPTPKVNPIQTPKKAEMPAPKVDPLPLPEVAQAPAPKKVALTPAPKIDPTPAPRKVETPTPKQDPLPKVAQAPAPKSAPVPTTRVTPVPVTTVQTPAPASTAPVTATPESAGYAPMPCCPQDPCQPVVLAPRRAPNPMMGKGLLSRLRYRLTGCTSGCCPPTQTVQAPQTVAMPVPAPTQVVEMAPAPQCNPDPIVMQATPSPAPVVVQAPARFVKPAATRQPDWRTSWGNCSSPASNDNAPPPAPPARQWQQVATPVQKVSSRPAAGLPMPPASVTETKKGNDPLFRPDTVARRSFDPKTPGQSGSKAQTGELFKPGQSPTTSASAEKSKLPLGAQSVIAASNGLDKNVKYLPVPIVTIPQPQRPPVPPVPQVPQAPQPNNGIYQNAFTPRTPPDAQQGNGPAYLPPAMGPRAMGPGNGPMMGPMGMMPGYPPMAPGYPGMMPPGRYPMPMYGRGMSPQGPYAMPGYGMPPGMYGYPYPPMGMPMQPPGRGTVPYAYQGPMPPNPFVAPAQPNGYRTGYSPAVPTWNAGQPRNTAMDRPAVPAGVGAAQAATNEQIAENLAVLKTSTYPSQREWAANNLATFDWRANPIVVQALVTAAKEDPAPTVRSGCVYNLGRMGITAEPVLATLQQLKNDRDPRVRVDAEKALARLNAGQQPGTSTASDRNAVQPVRAVNP